MKPRLKITALLILVWGLSLLVMPADQGVVPPSRFFINSGFSQRYATFLAKPRQDYVFLGNSRALAGLMPSAFAHTLSRLEGRPVRAHSLAVEGGFFPVYYEIVKTLMAGRLPCNLVVGIGPRDFNLYEYRQNKVRNLLVASSGYRLLGLPYASPSRWLEGHIADFMSALLPAMVYRSQVIAALVEFPQITLWDPPPGQAPRIWHLAASFLLPELSLPVPRPGWWRQFGPSGLGNKLRAYFLRWRNLRRWQPWTGDIMGPDGFRVCRRVSAAERRQRSARVRSLWRRRRKREGRRFHQGEYCLRRFSLGGRPGSYSWRFLDYLQEQGVGVYFVLLPALELEGCENHPRVQAQVMDYLRGLRRRFPNIRGVIDLNRGFRHRFYDPRWFDDLEHLNCAGAREVSRELAREIYRLRNGGGMGRSPH